MSVLVIGMHRSGTSAATRVVNLLGVPIGSDMLSADTYNPYGYWESVSLRDINVQVLERMGGEWAGPPPFEPGWEHRDDLSDLRESGRSTFQTVYPSPPWVWKDPHNCLTLPFWRKVIGTCPVIFMYREPTEVIASLQLRDGFSPLFALALWERYVRDAMINVAGHPVLVTSYDQLLNDPIAWCRRTCSFLHDYKIPVIHPTPYAEVKRFLSVGRRSAAAHRALDPVVSSLGRDLASLLESLPDQSDAFEIPDLPPPTLWGHSLLEERRKAFLNVRELRHELDAVEERIVNLRPLGRPLVRPIRRALHRVRTQVRMFQERLCIDGRSAKHSDAHGDPSRRQEGVGPHADVSASKQKQRGID